MAGIYSGMTDEPLLEKQVTATKPAERASSLTEYGNSNSKKKFIIKLFARTEP